MYFVYIILDTHISRNSCQNHFCCSNMIFRQKNVEFCAFNFKMIKYFNKTSTFLCVWLLVSKYLTNIIFLSSRMLLHSSSSSYHECVKNVGLQTNNYEVFTVFTFIFIVETLKTDVFTFTRHFLNRCRTKTHLHIKDV